MHVCKTADLGIALWWPMHGFASVASQCAFCPDRLQTRRQQTLRQREDLLDWIMIGEHEKSARTHKRAEGVPSALGSARGTGTAPLLPLPGSGRAFGELRITTCRPRAATRRTADQAMDKKMTTECLAPRVGLHSVALKRNTAWWYPYGWYDYVLEFRHCKKGNWAFSDEKDTYHNSDNPRMSHVVYYPQWFGVWTPRGRAHLRPGMGARDDKRTYQVT